jgi:hypothetical protein
MIRIGRTGNMQEKVAKHAPHRTGYTARKSNGPLVGPFAFLLRGLRTSNPVRWVPRSICRILIH